MSVRLILAGDGPFRGEIQAEVERQGVAPYVDFLGVRKDVPELLASSDIFVLPSKTEGLSAALIEAGLSGLPSVATDVGAVSDVITHGETGLMVAPGDTVALIDAVRKLAGDEEMRLKMGEAATSFCEANFGMDRVAVQYEDLITSLIGAN